MACEKYWNLLSIKCGDGEGGEKGKSFPSLIIAHPRLPITSEMFFMDFLPALFPKDMLKAEKQ